MIKDCTEDHMMILNSIRKAPRPLSPHPLDKGNMGYPTVEEVMKLSDVYYGPLKMSRPLHGSL
jgi:hypothetical protein